MYCEVCEKEVDQWKIHRKRQSHRKKNKMYAPEKIELMDEKDKFANEMYEYGRHLRDDGVECETDTIRRKMENKIGSMDESERQLLSGFHSIMFDQLRALRQMELAGLIKIKSN
jgi:hypothetical protein